MKRRILIAALAAMTLAMPMAATAQASYKITSIKQIAPNTLKYLLSHWMGAGPLEAKLRDMEVKLTGKSVTLEGAEGKEGHEGAQGLRGEAGTTGAQGEAGTEGAEGAEGKASTLAGPQGPAGPAGAIGEAGPEGPEGKEGKEGAKGAVGPACEASNAACRGPEGPAGPRGEAGIDSPSEVEALITHKTLTKQEVEELASRTETAAFQVPFMSTGVIHHGQTSTVFRRSLAPGDYIITGSVNFRAASFEGKVQSPEEQVCVTFLGGSQIAETNTINPVQVENRAPQYRSSETSAVIVATTGAVTQESTLEISCTNVMQTGPQTTEPSGGTLVATGVTFK